MILNLESFTDALPAGYDGIFDWDYLLPAWSGTGCRPMDVDAMIERGGAFLLFETKAPGKDIPEGQARALWALAQLPGVTVIHCAKRAADVDGFDVWSRGRATWHRGDADALIAFCRKWFLRASENTYATCTYSVSIDAPTVRAARAESSATRRQSLGAVGHSA